MSKSCCAALTLLIIGLVLLLSGQSVDAQVPDPTLLPVATTSQAPLTDAYNALNVPAIPAGGFYLDPTTNTKIYKLTSVTWPASNANWGHDYAEGGDEVSLPYKPDGITRAVLVRQNGSSGGPWWLIDFTPGMGVGKPRQLAAPLAPWIDLAFTFSNNPATPYYAYVSNGSTIYRIDIRNNPVTEAPGNGWPVTDPNAIWMHQSENDGFFVWMRGANGPTIVGYEPSTGTLKTYTDANLNEPRVDRAGRYVGITMNTPSNGIVVWDWNMNSVVWSASGVYPGIPFAHVASLRNRWLGVDWNLSWPGQFSMFIPDVPNSAQDIGGPANGTLTHGNGNWIQQPADLDDQWALFSHYGSLQPPTGYAWLAPGGLILITKNGQRRLLGHPYNTTATYNYLSFPKFSSDGQYVLFTSDMNGSGRSDVFLAELPTRSSTEAVVWTNLVNVTATGNSLQKTGGCDGCQDAGATSQQQIMSGDGYVEFTAGETTTTRGAGLSNGNTDTSGADIDFAIALWNDGNAHVYESGTWKANLSAYMTGDVFRVAVEGGVVKYYKNGTLGYTGTVAPTFPLLVDSSLWGANSTINNVVLGTP